VTSGGAETKQRQIFIKNQISLLPIVYSSKVLAASV
jgi:hypothetical protein